MKCRCVTLPGLIMLLLVLIGPPNTCGQSDVESLARDNTRFAFDLYHKLAPTQGNIFFSPYSISTALAMTYAGARGNTEKEMAATLRFSLSQTELHPTFAKMDACLKKAERSGIRLRVANSLWPQKDYPFLEEYISLLKKHYGVLVTAVDYRSGRDAAQTINNWVANKTDDRIKAIVTPDDLTTMTRLVLVNAIYFKGKWASQFKARNTKQEPFHVAPDKPIQAPMMTQKLKCRYASLPSLDLLELPYVGNGLSMIVLLPKKIDGVQEVESELTADNLTSWLGALREQEVLVFLPRFKTTCTFGLRDALSSMGMLAAFRATKANFAGMDGRPDWIYVSAVIHKAFVEVNEEGTEAAAATAVTMLTSAVPASPPTFRADHPFVFLIQEKGTGSILFAGRITDPTKSGE
ncbi:MAG: serpin family protein [bacterium]